MYKIFFEKKYKIVKTKILKYYFIEIKYIY